MSEFDPCVSCEYNELVDIIDPDHSKECAENQAEGCQTFIDTVRTVYHLEVGCGMADAALMRSLGDEKAYGLAMATMEQIVARHQEPKAELPVIEAGQLITKQDVVQAWGHEYQASAILGNMKRIARSGRLPLIEGVTDKGIAGITKESAKQVLEMITAPGYEGPGVGVETKQVLKRIAEKVSNDDA